MATGMTRNADSSPLDSGLEAYCGLGQVGGRELVLIHDNNAAGLQVGEADLQGRRIHRDQDVRRIAGGANLVIGEIELEAANPSQRTRRCAYFGRIIGKRADHRPGDRGNIRELTARQLHAVARIAGEPHRGTTDLNEFLFLG